VAAVQLREHPVEARESVKFQISDFRLQMLAEPAHGWRSLHGRLQSAIRNLQSSISNVQINLKSEI
jgi:hypothetical protein